MQLGTSNAALFLFGSMSVALAGAPVSGKVTRLNQNAHTFTVQWVENFTTPDKRPVNEWCDRVLRLIGDSRKKVALTPRRGKANLAIIPNRYIARCKARIVPHFRAVECQRICSPDC